MKKVLSILTMTLGLAVFAAAPVSTNDAYKVNRKDKINRDAAAGTNLYNAQQFGVKAQWDYAVQGGAANSDITLLDHEGLAVTLPANAIIKNCFIDVVTQPTSSTLSGKVSFSSSDVADLKAAALVHTGYLATTGRYVCVPVDATANTWLKPGSEVTLKMRIGSEALTAGKINIWVNYALSD